MFATQVLPETLSNDLEENDVEVVGFIVVDNKKYEVKKGETKIGRDSSVCSIVIDNFTISKTHAVIESDGIDDTFIYDVGSTNQTKLGKKVLKPYCRYKLENESNILLGNILVKFIIPPYNESNEPPGKSDEDNYNPLDECGDIFDIATQAVAPQSDNLNKILAFENQSKNFQGFKVPNTSKPTVTPETSKNIFDIVTQCALNPQETISETDKQNNSHESSGIFSLDTQAQIGKPEVNRENKTESKSSHEEEAQENRESKSESRPLHEEEPQENRENKSESKSLHVEVDEIKSLLNDGEDELLNAVMSLQSPNEISNAEVVEKGNIEAENLTQVLNAPTQIQDEKEESHGEKGRKLNSPPQDLLDTSLYKPTSASTPLTSKLKPNVSESSSYIQQIEDLIKTQEFRINDSHKEHQPENHEQIDDEETQPYFEETLINTSIIESKSHEEDFILTQTFETSNVDQQVERPAVSIPESDTEDFIETQIYDVEKEKSAVKEGTTVIGASQRENEDRNNEEDFISTQAFREPAGTKSVEGSGRDDSCEDFIATQVAEFTVKDTFREPAGTKSVEDSERDDPCEDFIATQVAEFTVKNTFREPAGDKSVEGSERDDTCEDFIATQVAEFTVKNTFREPAGDKSVEGSEGDDTCEDFIATQVAEFTVKNSPNPQCTRTEPDSQEYSPDLLAADRNSEDCIGTQIFEPTEPINTFSGVEKFYSKLFSDINKDDSDNNQKSRTESSGDETESDLEILLDKNEIIRKDDKSIERCHTSESHSLQTFKQERSPESERSNDSYVFEIQSESNLEEIQRETNPVPNSDSDATDCEEISVLSSKITVKQEPPPRAVEFEGPRVSREINVVPNSDSDETDCEEISVLSEKITMKQEPPKADEFEDQVLPLAQPNNSAQISQSSTLEESPKFEIKNDDDPWSPLSLEMPSTQDMESSMKRLQRNESERRDETVPEEDFQPTSSKVQKIEVGFENSSGNSSFWNVESSERKVLGPKKRPLDSNDVQVVPVKKSKTEERLSKSCEKQFSKLVQAHDIALIQPNRTRNSMKNFQSGIKTETPVENGSNKTRPTSRRKSNTKRGGSIKVLNCDIIPYLIKKRERSSPNERKIKPIEGSTRVLRSSMRNSLSPNNILKPSENSCRTRRSNSRGKKNENYINPCVHVAFTGFDSASLDTVIYDLGGKKTNDLSQSEVVVADKVRRTVKFLCAIGLSLPITSPQWLLSCKKEKKFLNPWNFILEDEESEDKWDFDLRTSLERSKKVKLFHGFNIFATKSAKPPVKDLLAIVECCGGNPIFEPPRVWPQKTIIVSCLEDKNLWPAAKLRNVQIVHYEFILTCVLRQKIDFKTHKLR